MMTEYCRLCADLKEPDEIVASIDEVEQSMEQKLRACCQWTTENTEHRLPHGVCSICFDKLEKCWLFAQSVQLAQRRLLEIIEFESEAETKPFAIETIKIEYDYSDYSSNFAPSPQPDANSSECQEMDDSVTTDMTVDPFESVENGVKRERDSENEGQACGETFDDLNLFNTHLQNHDREDDGLSLYKCKECGKCFKSKTCLEQHHLRTHANLRPFACDQCDWAFFKAHHLTKHKKVVHEGFRPFECEQCGRRMSTRMSLRRHYTTHSDARPFPCDQCDSAFKIAISLKTHKLAMHPTGDGNARKRPHKCDVCGKSFYTNAHLQEHRQTHAKQRPRPYACDQCTSTFAIASTLITHKRMVHEGIRPFGCQQCGRHFATKATLKVHLTSHSDARPFPCDECSSAFKEARSLKSHKLTFHQPKE